MFFGRISQALFVNLSLESTPLVHFCAHLAFPFKSNTVMIQYTPEKPLDSCCHTTHPTRSLKWKTSSFLCIISHAQFINLHTLAGCYTPPAWLLLLACVTNEIFFFFFYDWARWQTALGPKENDLNKWRGRMQRKIQMKQDKDEKQWGEKEKDGWLRERMHQ